MVYNTDVLQDEYVAYIFNNKSAAISKCKTIYKLTNNTLTAEQCSDAMEIPFAVTKSDASTFASSVIFTRSTNHPNQSNVVLGPDGIWRVDQVTGKIEFCVFGDMMPKCVTLKQN
jgi:hypothetical protein